MRDEVTRDWRRLYYEKLYGLYSSPNVILVTLRRMGWADHVARRGKSRVSHEGFLVRKLWEKGYFADKGIYRLSFS
jgi:hypothetical protein